MKDVMVYKMNEKITVIGPAIIDVLAGPINESLFKAGTMPMDNIKLSFGGNAYNEAATLFHLGVPVDLIRVECAIKNENESFACRKS